MASKAGVRRGHRDELMMRLAQESKEIDLLVCPVCMPQMK
jgi:hypothetical protein